MKTTPPKPRARRRNLLVAPLTLFIGMICVIALSLSSRQRMISITAAHAQEVAADAPPPVESTGAPGTADLRAVVNFRQIAHHRAAGKAGLRRGTLRPMPNPRSGAPVVGNAVPSGSGAIAEVTAQSPAASASFQALGDNGTVIPPDTQGTVGPNHLMVTLNSQVRIQSKAGVTVSTVSLNSFWSSMSITEAFDPRIVYDPYANRWIFSAGADPQVASASILIGVSQTSDPTGKWNLYKVKADSGSTLWADFPTLGFNANWIVVQANMFSNSTNAYSHSNIWAFNKANLYVGSTGSYTLLQVTSGFTQFPAVTYDNTVTTEYLLELWNGSVGQLRMSKITGPVGSEVLTTGIAYPSAAAAWQDSAAVTNFAPQLGSASGIDTDDDRILNCVYRNGALWAAQTIYLPASGTPTRSSAQWWEIDTASGDVGGVLQRGLIDDPTNNFDFAYPSIAVNKNSDAMIGYSRFGASQYASANYTFHAAADAAGTNQGDTVLKAGEATYFKDFGYGDNRWGDYSNTAVDPANDTDLWTIQEYASTGNNWGTWWGQIALASSPTPTPTPTPTSTPTPTPSPSPTPTPTPTATPSPTPSPLTIGVSSLPNGKLKTAYSAALNISGGKPPYNSFIAAGSMPPGLSLGSSTGVISGTPLKTGKYSFAVKVIDSASNSVSKKLSIQVTR